MTQKDNDTKKIPDSNGNSERKEIPDRKGILAWIRDILHLHEIEKTPLPSIPPPGDHDDAHQSRRRKSSQQGRS